MRIDSFLFSIWPFSHRLAVVGLTSCLEVRGVFIPSLSYVMITRLGVLERCFEI